MAIVFEGVATAAARRLTAIAPSLRLRPGWVEEQRPYLGDGSSASDAASDALLQRLDAADIRESCDGSLPLGLDRQHNIFVEGYHFVQLLASADIAHPKMIDQDEHPVEENPDQPGVEGTAREDGVNPYAQKIGASASRASVQRGAVTLKICLSDGTQVVCGIERRPIAALRGAQPGAKMVLGNRPLLRRGLLLLEPQHLELVGPLRDASSAAAIAAGRVSEPLPLSRPLQPAPPLLAPPTQAALSLPSAHVACSNVALPVPPQPMAASTPVSPSTGVQPHQPTPFPAQSLSSMVLTQAPPQPSAVSTSVSYISQTVVQPHQPAACAAQSLSSTVLTQDLELVGPLRVASSAAATLAGLLSKPLPLSRPLQPAQPLLAPPTQAALSLPLAHVACSNVAMPAPPQPAAVSTPVSHISQTEVQPTACPAGSLSSTVSTQERYITVCMQPGKIGMGYKDTTRKITTVTKGGPAEAIGIRPGWRFHAIDGQPFSDELFTTKREGRSAFEATFVVQEPTHQDTSSQPAPPPIHRQARASTDSLQRAQGSGHEAATPVSSSMISAETTLPAKRKPSAPPQLTKRPRRAPLTSRRGARVLHPDRIDASTLTAAPLPSAVSIGSEIISVDD